MRIGVCGTMESNDCLITVCDYDSQVIEIESIVDDYFHEQIEKTIKQVLFENHLNNVKVHINDKGALDFTIKARLLTSIKRMRD